MQKGRKYHETLLMVWIIRKYCLAIILVLSHDWLCSYVIITDLSGGGRKTSNNNYNILVQKLD